MPEVFTTLAWDNIDRAEETSSGEGTSHRVNGTAVQERTTNVIPVQPSIISGAKTKQRSIDIPPLVLTTNNAEENVLASLKLEVQMPTLKKI